MVGLARSNSGIDNGGGIEMSEWQPIETAPKDGTFLIGGWTSNGQNHPMEWEVDIAWREGDSFGVDVSLESGETMRPTIDQITHWMPFPAPPVQP